MGKQIVFSSGTTGTPKFIEYGAEEFKRIELQTDYFFVNTGFDFKGKNSYSIFPTPVPNMASFQAIDLNRKTKHLDIGNLLLKIETTKPLIDGLFAKYPPNLIVGDAVKMLGFLQSLSEGQLSTIEHITTGSNKPPIKLKEYCDEKGIGMSSIYGRTEEAVALITEKDKWEEGYTFKNRPDLKFEIVNGEIVINGENTGDMGIINEFGKLDLDISRTEPLEKTCG